MCRLAESRLYSVVMEEEDGGLCDFCQYRWVPQFAEEVVLKYCTGIEWLCEYRCNMVSNLPDITVNQNKLLSNQDYMNIIRKVVDRPDFLVIRKVMLVVVINKEIRSTQPHLKEICDLIDKAIVLGDMCHEYLAYCSVENFGGPEFGFPMTSLGQELEKDTEPLEGTGKFETKKPYRYTVEDHLMTISFGFHPGAPFQLPCSFCSSLKRNNPYLDIHCSFDEQLDRYIYECVFQLPPQMKSTAKWNHEVMQCYDLSHYFERINHIFLTPNLFRASIHLVSFNNQVLTVFPSMKKYIILMEAIMLKGIYYLDRKYFAKPILSVQKALNSIQELQADLPLPDIPDDESEEESENDEERNLSPLSQAVRYDPISDAEEERDSVA